MNIMSLFYQTFAKYKKSIREILDTLIHSSTLYFFLAFKYLTMCNLYNPDKYIYDVIDICYSFLEKIEKNKHY